MRSAVWCFRIRQSNILFTLNAPLCLHVLREMHNIRSQTLANDLWSHLQIKIFPGLKVLRMRDIWASNLSCHAWDFVKINLSRHGSLFDRDNRSRSVQTASLILIDCRSHGISSLRRFHISTILNGNPSSNNKTENPKNSFLFRYQDPSREIPVIRKWKKNEI